MKISKTKIQFFMADRKLTGKALADKIGMQSNNLSSIIGRGSCRPDTAARIADGLGVSVSEIMKEEA